ncbi:PREDICTED: PWWP domain-containing protein 2B [Nanorana parkeri]|uniref:PWWP domain-containing protein 2B n=1 Tax=Nanorana parkeri TaxID=125878 RepID=UPI000854EC60|nr:PREDICTED: PWWP domain-containing protein 2B [Nanorana parkeri]
MEAEDGQELRVGSLVPVLVEQMVNDTLLVTLSCGEKSYSGILLDCGKKSGLFCMPPPSVPKNEDSPNGSCTSIPTDANFSHPLSETPVQDTELPVKSNTDQVPPLLPLPGTAPSYPPYFEGAPFPPPLWIRHSYNQWVPQPPPRSIKRTKRRMSRNRDPGRLIMSTIRLRPRQVLCEKCKNTLNAEESPKDKNNTRSSKRSQSDDKERHKVESDPEERKTTKERREEHSASRDLIPRSPSKDLIPRSPVIKIVYSTPQGKGEVVKIPSRIHGSVEPFCPNQTHENGSRDQEIPKDTEQCQAPKRLADRTTDSQVASIPKLKLPKPLHSNADIPPPKIRLKPQRISDGQRVSVYKSELIHEVNVLQSSQASETDSSTYYMDSAAERSYQDASLGSSGEDDDFKGFPHSQEGHNLNLLVNYRKRKADSSSASLCSNDSLDESKSTCLELNRMDFCDLMPGDDISVSSSKDEQKTVPPLMVRLHSKSVSNCITVDGKTISVGDIVWGKVHGFPWWPARILSINVNQKENDDPPWQEATVSWFGSPTTSSLSVSKLSSFSEFFKLRFNRKKKGVYRKAIAEAAKATNHLTPEIRELLIQCET